MKKKSGFAKLPLHDVGPVYLATAYIAVVGEHPDLDPGSFIRMRDGAEYDIDLAPAEIMSIIDDPDPVPDKEKP